LNPVSSRDLWLAASSGMFLHPENQPQSLSEKSRRNGTEIAYILRTIFLNLLICIEGFKIIQACHICQASDISDVRNINVSIINLQPISLQHMCSVLHSEVMQFRNKFVNITQYTQAYEGAI
jgi:hypothetical protein